jgi:hypothetical protein
MINVTGRGKRERVFVTGSDPINCNNLFVSKPKVSNQQVRQRDVKNYNLFAENFSPDVERM